MHKTHEIQTEHALPNGNADRPRWPVVYCMHNYTVNRFISAYLLVKLSCKLHVYKLQNPTSTSCRLGRAVPDRMMLFSFESDLMASERA